MKGLPMRSAILLVLCLSLVFVGCSSKEEQQVLDVQENLNAAVETPAAPAVPEVSAPAMPEVPSFSAASVPAVPEVSAPAMPEVPTFTAPTTPAMPEVPTFSAPTTPAMPETSSFSTPSYPSTDDFEIETVETVKETVENVKETVDNVKETVDKVEEAINGAKEEADDDSQLILDKEGRQSIRNSQAAFRRNALRLRNRYFTSSEPELPHAMTSTARPKLSLSIVHEPVSPVSIPPDELNRAIGRIEGIEEDGRIYNAEKDRYIDAWMKIRSDADKVKSRSGIRATKLIRQAVRELNQTSSDETIKHMADVIVKRLASWR